MKTLEPRQIHVSDVANWFMLALGLFMRRPLLFISSLVAYFLVAYFATKATSSLGDYVSSTLLFSGFVVVFAVIFFLVLTAFTLQAEAADNSNPSGFGVLLESIIPSQTAIFRMALMAMFVGAFYWVLSLNMSREHNIVTSTARVIDVMLAQKGLPFVFECQLAATFLYFLFLALFSLRLFFAIPLTTLHGLDYQHAQSLSHKAIMMNIQPMSVVLLLWSMILMVVMLLAPLLSTVLFPCFGIYLYVAYRQVFLGFGENSPAKAVLKNAKIPSPVTRN